MTKEALAFLCRVESESVLYIMGKLYAIKYSKGADGENVKVIPSSEVPGERARVIRNCKERQVQVSERLRNFLDSERADYSLGSRELESLFVKLLRK